MNPLDIINKYTAGNVKLREILIGHSEAVRDKALEIAERKHLDIDIAFVQEAAMLHDIGVERVDAPGISCYGDEPYIRHGVCGREILEVEGLPHHALVCERHTGSGITKEQIVAEHLPLPHRDMLPLSLEEKLICYADKFFSKSRDLRTEKSVEKIISQMQQFGYGSLERFVQLHVIFS
ncbi:MAG: HD domain-containing protein [Lachnospiraceae bacterium]|nr:HD domain-containing protein [Prevotella sp.]MCM1075343.1 HD domain-containing protein [Ruminococcus sp.]MCM1225212.1 HD domain-containing protein [Lachnospiraceae bacterium]